MTFWKGNSCLKGDMRFDRIPCLPDAERITGEDHEDGRESWKRCSPETRPPFDGKLAGDQFQKR